MAQLHRDNHHLIDYLPGARNFLEQVSKASIDVLLVTVDDSNHLLSYEEVDSLIQRLEPRVVVPMHYQIPGLTAEDTGLEPPEGFLATQRNVKRLDGDTAVFSPQSLPSQTEVWLFQPSPVSLATPPAKPL